jgi:N-acetylmuramic acid 6-phosphate etherase
MVDLKPASAKLVERAKRIIMMLAGLDYTEAARIFDQSERNVKVSIVMARKGMNKADAEALLERTDGFLARALGEQR